MAKVVSIAFLFLLAAGLGVTLFFLPKNAGGDCLSCPDYPGVQRVAYECLGYRFNSNNQCEGCRENFLCVGVTLGNNKKCYSSPTNDFENWEEVPCA